MTKEYAIGLDIETTGLEPDALILEIALVLFNSNLEEEKHITKTIYHPLNEIHARMGNYVADMHTKNGLLDEIKTLNPNQTLTTIEQELCDWIDEHTSGTPLPMLGSSIHFDRTLIEHQMPTLYNKFHYRSIDATSIKLAVEGILSREITPPATTGTTHRAYDDILASATTTKHYLDAYKTYA